MPYLLSEIPLTPLSGAPVSLAAITAGTDEADVAESVAAGDTADLLTKFNRHAARLDAVARAVGGYYCIQYGCTVTAVPATLNVAISDGFALIDGLVEVKSLANLTLPDATARVWLWLKQDGTWTYTTTATPPVGKVIYVGSAVTSGGVVASVDATNGVFRLLNGGVWTSTTDTGYPSASPNSTSIMFCRTSGGTYLWDGAAWNSMGYRRNAVLSHSRTNMANLSQFGTGNTCKITNAVESQIHFSLCSVPEPGIYEYKGIAFAGGNTEFAGSNQNIKVWLAKATAATGVPSTLASTTAHTLAFGTDVWKWNEFTWGGSTAILDLRDSPFYWVVSQVYPSGFSAGEFHCVYGVEAQAALSTRKRDFFVTSSGAAFSYSAGVPNTGGAVDTTLFSYTEPRNSYWQNAADNRLCNAVWAPLLQRVG